MQMQAGLHYNAPHSRDGSPNVSHNFLLSWHQCDADHTRADGDWVHRCTVINMPSSCNSNVATAMLQQLTGYLELTLVSSLCGLTGQVVEARMSWQGKQQ